MWRTVDGPVVFGGPAQTAAPRPRDAATSGSSATSNPPRRWPIRLLSLYLLVAAVLLAAAAPFDGALSAAAQQIHIYRGLGLLQFTFNLFGHASTTILLVIVLLLVFRARNAAALLGISALLEGLIAHVVKWAVGRVRPWRGAGPFTFHPFAGGLLGWLTDAGNPSFPSGHVGVAFVNALCLSLLFPRGRVYFFLLAICAAATRVAQGAHWLSDVIAAAFCAVLAVRITAAQMQQRALQPETDLTLPSGVREWIRQRRGGLALAIVAAIIFIGAIPSERIVGSHEARVALTAHTMARSGWPWRAPPVTAKLPPSAGGGTIVVNPWVIPVFAGEVRLQKPPLPYWCTAVLMRLIGPGEWAVRLTPVLLALLAIPLLIELARRTSGPAAAAIIGWVWISTFPVVNEFRRATADPYLAFFVLLTVVAWVRNAAARPGVSARWILIFWLALALGALSKGPVILLHVPVAIIALTIARPQLRPALDGRAIRMHILGLALFLLIALPWPIAVLRTLPHAREIWRYESVGEFADNVHNARPWWFYLGALPQVLAPWIAFVVVGLLLVIGRRDARHRRHWFAPIWIALTVLVFSFANLKKAAYLLPMMPAVVLLASEGIAAVAAHLRRARTANAPPLVILRLSGAIILACGGIAIAWLAVKAMRQTGDFTAGRIALALAALALASLACLRASLAHRKWFQIQAAIAGCLMLLMILVSGTYAARPRAPIAFDGGPDAEVLRAMDGER